MRCARCGRRPEYVVFSLRNGSVCLEYCIGHHGLGFCFSRCALLLHPTTCGRRADLALGRVEQRGPHMHLEGINQRGLARARGHRHGMLAQYCAEVSNAQRRRIDIRADLRHRGRRNNRVGLT